MVNKRERQLDSLNKIQSLLHEIVNEIDIIIVEGHRDESAIRVMGYVGDIDICSHSGLTEHDLAHRISLRAKKALVLTDYDPAGKKIASRLSKLLELEGVSVNWELRRLFGKHIGVLGVKTLESLDDILLEFQKSIDPLRMDSID